MSANNTKLISIVVPVEEDKCFDDVPNLENVIVRLHSCLSYLSLYGALTLAPHLPIRPLCPELPSTSKLATANKISHLTGPIYGLKRIESGKNAYIEA